MNNVETYVFQYQASSYLIATALFASRTLNGFDFGLTPLFRDRRGYMPPQLKTTVLTYSGVLAASDVVVSVNNLLPETTALFAARTLNRFDFSLTPLFRDRRDYMPPQLKTTALTYSGVENLDLCKRNVRLFWPLYNWGGFAMECYA